MKIQTKIQTKIQGTQSHLSSTTLFKQFIVSMNSSMVGHGNWNCYL